jgi:hypothetical protein
MLPNVLNRHFALISSLAVLGAVTLTPKASAQNVDVLFDLTVTSRCAFDNIVNGTLTNNTFNTFVTDPGNEGSATLTCSSQANFGISLPVADAGNPVIHSGVEVASQATANPPIGSVTSTGGGSLFNISDNAGITDELITVTMTVTDTEVIPAGSYQYRVTLTVVAL